MYSTSPRYDLDDRPLTLTLGARAWANLKAAARRDAHRAKTRFAAGKRDEREAARAASLTGAAEAIDALLTAAYQGEPNAR